MTRRAALLTGAAIVLVALVLVLTPRPTREDRTPPDAANPTWPNYDEDLKQQIGAGPVAQWQGEPIDVRRQGPLIEVTFRLSGPWTQRDAALPVLLRDPLGHVHRNAGATRQDARITYTFQLPPDAAQTLFPWIELRFPRHERRLVLSPTGAWQAP